MELGSNLTEHTQNHCALLLLYVFVCRLMDSDSIWLTGRSLSSLWEEDISLAKGGRSSLSIFLTLALSDLCEIIMGNHKLSHQNVVPENNIHQYWRDQGQLLSAVWASSHCDACLFGLVFGPIATFSLPYSLNWSPFFHNLLLHFFFLSIWPSSFITYLRICCLHTWQPVWTQVQFYWRGMALLPYGPSFIVWGLSWNTPGLTVQQKT